MARLRRLVALLSTGIIGCSVPLNTEAAESPASNRQGVEMDVSKWPRKKHVRGWIMRVPEDWEDTTPGEGDFETSDISYVRGPKNCFAEFARCAEVGVRRFSPNADTSKETPEGYLRLSDPKIVQSTVFLNQRRFIVSGESALDVCIKDKMTGVVQRREVVLKHKRALYVISYREIGPDGNISPNVKSPQDWRFSAFFDKMLSTFSFYK